MSSNETVYKSVYTDDSRQQKLNDNVDITWWQLPVDVGCVGSYGDPYCLHLESAQKCMHSFLYRNSEYKTKSK